MKPEHRELGTITKAEACAARSNELETVWVDLDLGGAGQGFGGLYLPDKALQTSFLLEVMRVVGVTNQKELVGKKCYALRAFSHWNESICGLESEDGQRRMTINNWRWKEFGRGKSCLSTRLEEKKKDLQNSIDRMRREIQENEARLQTLADDYVEWDDL